MAVAVAEVEAGGTVHIRALEVAGHPIRATLGSAIVVGAVLVVLWWFSRTEGRDRRRVLTALGLYAGASVGLAGVTALVAQSGGGEFWTAAATFVEKIAEAFGLVAVLVAVLVGIRTATRAARRLAAAPHGRRRDGRCSGRPAGPAELSGPAALVTVGSAGPPR